MLSTTATIEYLWRSANENMTRAEFDELITEIQADSLSRLSSHYKGQYETFENSYDLYASQSCEQAAKDVRAGEYVTTVGNWGLSTDKEGQG